MKRAFQILVVVLAVGALAQTYAQAKGIAGSGSKVNGASNCKCGGGGNPGV